jgi:PAS domain S-box-containing protein
MFGKAIRSLGTLTDITEKKRAEQIRRENEQRYKTLFEFSPSGLLLEDATGTIVNVNEAMATIVGYTREELIGKNVSIFVSAEQTNEVEEHIRDILAGKTLVHQVTNIKKDGTKITIELRESKIGLPDGTKGILVVANDVTERLHNERELENQFEQLQAIYQLTDSINRANNIETIYQEALNVLTGTLKTDSASILTFDPDGVMRFKAWCGISDWYRKQIEGHSPWTRDAKDPVPLLISDVYSDPTLASLLPVFKKENIKSVGFIPLVHQGAIIGKFMVYYAESHAFTEAESQLLQTFAGHIAFAIERHRADLQIAASEERYRSLAEAANDAIMSINRMDVVEYVNSYAAKQFNKTREEIIGKPRSLLFPPEVVKSQGEILQRVFEQGEPVQSEYPLRLPDGLHWHDTYLVPIREKQGTIVSVLGISRDITERKNAEEAIRKSAEQQGLVLRSLPMVFYTTKTVPGMPTTWISEQVKDITGFSPEEYIQDPSFWRSRIHPLDMEWVIKEYESVVTQGAVRIEYRWKCADGLYHWFADQTVLINDLKGKPKEVIGIWLDITSRKMAEGELRESEEKWRTLMENSPGLVHLIDRNGKILYINRATLGYERDKVIGSSVYDYATPEIAAFMQSKVKEVFEEKHSVWFEIPAAGPYGSEAWYSASIGPMVRDGEVAFAIMESLDITDHKRRENLQTAVYRIAQVADRSQTLDELFGAVHGIIREAMRANNFYIALYNEQEDVLTFPYFVDEIDTPPLPGPPGRGMTAYVLRGGKPLLCGLTKFEDLVRQGEIELVGIPSPVWLGVPLIVENKVIGVMALQDYHDEQAYGEQELHVLEYISSQVAMTIRRKQTEEDLRSSEERYRLLFEESKDCIYITSAEENIVDINPAGVELFGYSSKEELISVDVSRDLYWDASQREEESRVMRRQGYVQDFELVLKKKDGTKLIVLDTATTVRDTNGNVVGYRGIMRDMTERKHS